MAARNREFYVRIVLSSFTRRAADILPLSKIKEEARLIISSDEVEKGLLPVIEEMATAGRLMLFDPRKMLYRLNH